MGRQTEPIALPSMLTQSVTRHALGLLSTVTNVSVRLSELACLKHDGPHRYTDFPRDDFSKNGGGRSDT